MATVRQVLRQKHPGVIGARPTTTVAEAARTMMEADVSCVVVEQRPDIFGILTERDVVRRVVAAGKDPASTCLAEVMSSPVITCAASDETDRCLQQMAEHRIRHLVVIEDSDLLGVISLRDIPGI